MTKFMSKIHAPKFTEGQRIRIEHREWIPDPEGEHVVTYQLPGNAAQVMPIKGYEALNRYQQACQAAKDEYLAKLEAARKQFDAEMDQLKPEDLVR